MCILPRVILWYYMCIHIWKFQIKPYFILMHFWIYWFYFIDLQHVIKTSYYFIGSPLPFNMCVSDRNSCLHSLCWYICISTYLRFSMLYIHVHLWGNAIASQLFTFINYDIYVVNINTYLINFWKQHYEMHGITVCEVKHPNESVCNICKLRSFILYIIYLHKTCPYTCPHSIFKKYAYVKWTYKWRKYIFFISLLSYTLYVCDPQSYHSNYWVNMYVLKQILKEWYLLFHYS